jgi:hypothetical protein
MKPFDAKRAYDTAAKLGVWQVNANVHAQVFRSISVAKVVLPLLIEIHTLASEWGLATSPEAIESTITTVSNQKKLRGGDLNRILREINRRVADELGKVPCFFLTPDEAAIDKRPILVPVNFTKEGAVDGAEAVRCYAAGCYTAAGFHAVRIAERVARSLIPRAGLRTKKFYPSIDSIVSAVEKKLRKEDERRRRTPKGRRGMSTVRLKWLTDMVATFRSVAHSWRNPIGHYKVCDEVEALELINFARALVRKYEIVT